MLSARTIPNWLKTAGLASLLALAFMGLFNFFVLPPCGRVFAQAECPVGATATFTGNIGIQGNTAYTATLTAAPTDNYTITLPSATATLISLAGSTSTDNALVRFDGSLGTLQNYTSGAPLASDTGTLTVTQPIVMDDTTLQIQEGGDTLTLSVPTLTAARAVTLPDTAGVILLASSTATLTNKTFNANGGGNSLSNVDVADLAAGVDGELITWSATAAPATVAVGISGQVLTSNGAGSAPTFQAAAGGGANDIGARAYHSAGQSIANNTIVTLAFDSERWDTNSIHDATTNNERLTATTAGVYAITVGVRWQQNTSGYREVRIMHNGGTILARSRDDAPGATIEFYVTVSTIYLMAATDYVSVAVYQNSGGALNIENNTNDSPEFTMQCLSC